MPSYSHHSVGRAWKGAWHRRKLSPAPLVWPAAPTNPGREQILKQTQGYIFFKICSQGRGQEWKWNIWPGGKNGKNIPTTWTIFWEKLLSPLFFLHFFSFLFSFVYFIFLSGRIPPGGWGRALMGRLSWSELRKIYNLLKLVTKIIMKIF